MYAKNLIKQSLLKREIESKYNQRSVDFFNSMITDIKNKYESSRPLPPASYDVPIAATDIFQLLNDEKMPFEFRYTYGNGNLLKTTIWINFNDIHTWVESK